MIIYLLITMSWAFISP